MKRLQKTKQFSRKSKDEQKGLSATISHSEGLLDLLEEIIKDRLEVAEKRLEAVLDGNANDLFATLGARKELRHLLWLFEQTTEE